MRRTLLTVLATLAVVAVVAGMFFAGKLVGKNETTEETTQPNAIVEQTVAETQAVIPVTTEAQNTVKEEKTTVVTHVVTVPVEQKVPEKHDVVPEKETEKPAEKPTEPATKANKPDKNVETTKNSVAKITREQAKKIALDHAGLKESEVRGLEVELDFEKGVYEYEVSFESGKYDYDYEINGDTGKIKYADKEIDD